MKISLKELKCLIKESIESNESNDLRSLIRQVFDEQASTRLLTNSLISRGISNNDARDFSLGMLSLKVVSTRAKNPRKVKKSDQEDWQFYMQQFLPTFATLGIKPEDCGIVFPKEEWLTSLERSKDVKGFHTYDDDDDYEYYRGRR